MQLPPETDSVKVSAWPINLAGTIVLSKRDTNRIELNGNTMDHDVNTTVTQTDLPPLYWAGRLANYAVVYRQQRSQLGGGFGDQHKYPYAWGVLVYLDGMPARVISARGSDREWTSLDRLERWLREQGFRYFWVRNELEALGIPEDAMSDLPPVGIK